MKDMAASDRLMISAAQPPWRRQERREPPPLPIRHVGGRIARLGADGHACRRQARPSRVRQPPEADVNCSLPMLINPVRLWL